MSSRPSQKGAPGDDDIKLKTCEFENCGAEGAKELAVATGLKQTFRQLTKTKNDAAVGVLLVALESPHREIAEGALGALLDRRGEAGGQEILSRFPTMDESWKEVIRGRPGRMTGTLRNAVVGNDKAQCRNACQAIVEFRDFDLMPALINAAEDHTNPLADLIAKTVLELAEELYDELAQPRDYKQRRDPQRVRKNIGVTLENSVRRFHKHGRREILEAFLIVTNRDNLTLKKIIEDPFHKAYLPMVDVLTTSPRRGVMRLVLSFLDDAHAPLSALNVLSHRADSIFLGHLFKKIGFEPSGIAKNNLRRIESIPWIAENRELLDSFDDAQQHAAVQLVVGCQLPQEECLSLLEHLLTHGTTGGRCAVAAVLEQYHGVEANRLALAALDDPEPRVQAAIIPHLRQRGIPGAMNRLLALVDSPLEIVKAAAREQLVEFRFDRFVEAFDNLEEEVRHTTGLLVKKVDPQAAALLAKQLKGRSRTRRLRGIAMTEAMDMVIRMETHLIGLLQDEEQLVRLETVRLMAACESAVAIDALRNSLLDRSVPVQEAAEESLQEIGRRALLQEGHGNVEVTSTKQQEPVS